MRKKQVQEEGKKLAISNSMSRNMEHGGTKNCFTTKDLVNNGSGKNFNLNS